MKYLYILTPAVPRHDCHNNSIIPSVQFLGGSNIFEKIYWFINIDNPNSRMFTFENRQITIDNFNSIPWNKNIHIHLNTPEHPCFYKAFSHLIIQMKSHIQDIIISNDEYCFLWLEDDWIISKQDKIVRDLTYFINHDNILYYTLYKNKINMGGNPQFMKGILYDKYFSNLDLSSTNKRDPEIIIRNEIFKTFIFDDNIFSTLGLSKDIINNQSLTFKDKLIIANKLSSNVDDTFTIHNGMFGHVVEDIGDAWRDARGFTKWNMIQKEQGILPNENYTYN